MKKSIIAGLALLAVLLIGCKKEETPQLQLNAPVISADLVEGGVELDWQPVINALSYKVEYKKSTDVEYLVAGNPNYAPFLVTGIEYGNSYMFRVKSVNGDVESVWSNVVTVDAVKYLPKPVVRAESGLGFIEVDWEAVEGAVTYKVEHKLTISSEYTSDYTGNGTDVDFHLKIKDLDYGVSYDVRVTASAPGYSDTSSDPATVSTPDAPSAMISTAAQFVEWLGTISDTYYDVAVLMNDIDMEGVTFTSASGFSGTFDAQGYSIKNITSNVPLFATNNGIIRNLVLDPSCTFTAGSNVFGALVAEDKGGEYNAVKAKGSVTYTANGNVADALLIGGLIGKADGAKLTDCSNSGAVKIDATGYSHKAVGLGGLVGGSQAITFDSCVNRGPVTLTANFGDPATELMGGDNSRGINIGGVLGYGYDIETEKFCTFKNCQNESAGIITLNHTKIDALPNASTSGYVGIGGIVGRARGNMKTCKNFAPINVTATSSDRSAVKRQNYCVNVGGLAGLARWSISFEACRNDGNITVAYDGKYNDNRNRGTVGGICGWQDYDGNDAVEGEADMFAYYCKVNGSITADGAGILGVGGIFGFSGKQIGNTVSSDCSIYYRGPQGYVGGLVGSVEDNPTYYMIRGCSCAATIVAEDTDTTDDKYFNVGGFIGQWGRTKSGETGSCLMKRTNDNVPCEFSGSVSSTTVSRVGILVGHIKTASGTTLKFGNEEAPIPVSGSFGKAGMELTTIHAGNVETYAIGGSDGATVNVNVSCATEAPTSF